MWRQQSKRQKKRRRARVRSSRRMYKTTSIGFGPSGRRNRRTGGPLLPVSWRRAAALLALALAMLAPVTAAAQAYTSPAGDSRSPVAFWDRIGDATLTQLIAEALEANPHLQVAEARLDGARAARVGAT